MCHVLEHISDLHAALGAVKRLLKPEGFLYVAVPNVGAWNASFAGWTGYEPYHFHYFHAASLKRVLEVAGFEVWREWTFEPISGWFNTLVRSLRHRLPHLSRDDSETHEDASRNGITVVGYNICRLVSGVLASPLRWAQGALGYGEELIVVARPRVRGWEAGSGPG
jgi:SAM-dependent methyltransferase